MGSLVELAEVLPQDSAMCPSPHPLQPKYCPPGTPRLAQHCCYLCVVLLSQAKVSGSNSRVSMSARGGGGEAPEQVNTYPL